jgi:hypothetical protein
MSEFKTEIKDFFDKLIAQDHASGFANEVVCCLPKMGAEPNDLSDDKFVMKQLTEYFGTDAISLKAVAIEKNAGGAGEHEFVIELSKRASSEIEFVKISIDSIPQDYDCNSFCTEFQEYEFVQPITQVVTAFK